MSEENFIATPPLTMANGNVRDANGDRVLVCNNEPGFGCDLYYSERLVDSDPAFVCPKCGRLGLRMEEATYI